MPDLAFSEMAFLNYRRERPDDLTKLPVKKARREKDKAADHEAEISRYFTSTKALAHNSSLPCAKSTENLWNEDETSRYSNKRRSCDRGNKSLPMVDLPAKPFLGFGNSGMNITSSAWLSRTVDRKEDQPQCSKSSTPTTYVSWSMSGARSRHSPLLYNAGNVPFRSSRQNLHVRRSMTKTPVAGPGIQHLDPDPDPVRNSSDKNIDHKHQYPPDGLVPDMPAATALDSFEKKNVSDVISKDSTQDKPFDQKIDSSEKTKIQQPATLSNTTATATDEDQTLQSSMGLVGGLEPLSEHALPDSFDAALDEFLQKCNPVGRKSSIISASRNNINSVSQLKEPSLVDYGNSIELEDVNNNLSVLENGRNQVRIDNSPSRHDSLKPPSLPPIQALDKDDDQANEHSKSTLSEERRPKHTGNLIDTQALGKIRDEGLPGVKMRANVANVKHSWDSYDGIYQQQLEPESDNLKGTQASGPTHEPGELGEDRDLASIDTYANHSNSKHRGYGGYGDFNPYDSNGYAMGLEEPSNSYYEEGLGSRLHNARNFSSYHTSAGGTCPAIPPHNNEAVLRQNFYTENCMGPKNSTPYPPHHDHGTSEWLRINDEDHQGPYSLNMLDVPYSWPLRPLHAAQRGSHSMPGDPSLQTNDDVLPGFWKPHKLY